MLRTCDGTDPNLTRPILEGEESGPWPGSVPCDCGRTFDDVEYNVTYPHEYIPTPEERQERIDAALLEHPELAEELAKMGLLGPTEKR